VAALLNCESFALGLKHNWTRIEQQVRNIRYSALSIAARPPTALDMSSAITRYPATSPTHRLGPGCRPAPGQGASSCHARRAHPIQRRPLPPSRWRRPDRACRKSNDRSPGRCHPTVPRVTNVPDPDGGTPGPLRYEPAPPSRHRPGPRSCGPPASCAYSPAATGVAAPSPVRAACVHPAAAGSVSRQPRRCTAVHPCHSDTLGDHHAGFARRRMGKLRCGRWLHVHT
jgi:hypothetical protein